MKPIDEMISKAPDELKSASLKLNAAMKRQRKAKVQSELWQIEAQLAKTELVNAQDEMNNIIPRWDPTTNTIEPMLEDKN